MSTSACVIDYSQRGSIQGHVTSLKLRKLECRPLPNVMAALLNVGGALCSTPQSLADAQYLSTVQ